MKNFSNSLKDLPINTERLYITLKLYTRIHVNNRDHFNFGSLITILTRNFRSSNHFYHLVYDVNEEVLKINWFNPKCSDNDINYKYFLDKKGLVHFNDILFDKSISYILHRIERGENTDVVIDFVRDQLIERINKLIEEESIAIKKNDVPENIPLF